MDICSLGTSRNVGGRNIAVFESPREKQIMKDSEHAGGTVLPQFYSRVTS
jgi:hypothetical protein